LTGAARDGKPAAARHGAPPAGQQPLAPPFGPAKNGLLVVTGLDRPQVRSGLEALDELLDHRCRWRRSPVSTAKDWKG
jgi:hypothetical protein